MTRVVSSRPTRIKHTLAIPTEPCPGHLLSPLFLGTGLAAGTHAALAAASCWGLAGPSDAVHRRGSPPASPHHQISERTLTPMSLKPRGPGACTPMHGPRALLDAVCPPV